MSRRIRITVLVENSVERPALLAEHGLAFWIETGSQRILFDTGQGGVLLSNAYRLGIPLDRVDAVVLSHGHYDHTGGLADALRGERPIRAYAHPDALKPKYARNQDGSSRAIGLPLRSERALERRRSRLILTESPTCVADGLMVTGPVPRETELEDTGGPFFVDSSCRVPDPLCDDQAMYFETGEGLVVLLGCAHAGVVNTLRYVRQLTGQQRIHAVLGGMHLVAASPQRLRWTIDQLREMRIDRLGPAHCTGRAATAALWQALPERCCVCQVGTQIEFELASPATRMIGG